MTPALTLILCGIACLLCITIVVVYGIVKLKKVIASLEKEKEDARRDLAQATKNKEESCQTN